MGGTPSHRTAARRDRCQPLYAAIQQRQRAGELPCRLVCKDKPSPRAPAHTQKHSARGCRRRCRCAGRSFGSCTRAAAPWTPPTSRTSGPSRPAVRWWPKRIRWVAPRGGGGRGGEGWIQKKEGKTKPAQGERPGTTKWSIQQLLSLCDDFAAQVGAGGQGAAIPSEHYIFFSRKNLDFFSSSKFASSTFGKSPQKIETCRIAFELVFLLSPQSFKSVGKT